MTRSEMFLRAQQIRDELETRHKYGTIKMANSDGTAISVENLQSELYSLVYKLSKLDEE